MATNTSSITDPDSLLDTIDSFHSNADGKSNVLLQNSVSNRPFASSKDFVTTTNDHNATSTSTNSIEGPNHQDPSKPSLSSKSTPSTTTTTSTTTTFDPIDFLNHHYQTESSLISALPTLRQSLNTRMTKLDESISTTIQKQSDLADLTLCDVSRAKAAIIELHTRITTVQSKAQQSEKAVQEITRDIKRLDYAKKHLSKTITALKRLHMLIHAVTQLRVCVRVCDPPDYSNASNLVDATQLLLGHFEGYMGSVEKMRMLKNDVEDMRVELYDGILFGFRVVGFGTNVALDKSSKTVRNRIIMNVKKKKKRKKQQQQKQIEHAQGEKGVVDDEDDHDDNGSGQIIMTPMPPQILSDACDVLDALGSKSRFEFLKVFTKDHLDAYNHLFHPRNNTSAGGASTTTSGANTVKPSFKIARTTSSQDGMNNGGIDAITGGGEDAENPSTSNPNPSSLDQIERRYAWYRRTVREIDEKYPKVFPKHWNMYYQLTRAFLIDTGKHILLLFSSKDGPDKDLRDRDVENVTVLLKSLQKTMLFEKEMTAWLQREFNNEFLDENGEKMKQSKGARNNKGVGEDGEALEFDDSGKAVVATSAEGIRIKYERQMKERKKKEDQAARAAMGLDDDVGEYRDPAKERVQAPVPPLIGVATTAFDKFMKPYIALEEQNMDEQLKESASDKTVDTRGELPVFTSSTALFLYIKNSITRCTVLTRGKTLFLLYRAFQSTLKKYAKVLAGKFPSTLSGATAAISGINIANLTGGSASSNAVYRIPAGEETTVCHVIDTCEYCVDTVEALQDLIADKIEQKYKSKIDMSGEQEAFHDVTAKGIRVLVSGLIQRTEPAFKSLSNINWSTIDVVGEESKYVRSMHDSIQPFVVTVKGLLPNSYFRSFCDQFATTFTNTFYTAITRCKRISESGTQQLLLDVYNLKTLLLRVPVLEQQSSGNNSTTNKTTISSSSSATIAPAMYTKMVTKQFARIETLLKLIGTPSDLLIDVFKVQWNSGSAYDLQIIMNLKGMKRNEQASMLEKFGVDPVTAYKGAAAGSSAGMMTENFQVLQDRSSDVAAKVNNDLIQMKQKVDDFRKAFR